MDPINQLNPVLDALRRQLAENLERMRKSGKLARGSAAATGRAAASAAPSLDAVLAQRLGGPQARGVGLAAAARIFVETVLLAEFGEELLSDPGLGPLLDDISSAFRDDPATKADFELMLEELQRR
jgi:hypothetical protein